MSFSAYSYAELLRRARTLYTGARDVPEATATLVPDYYESSDDFDQGLALVADMQSQIGALRSEERDQYEATETAQQHASEVRARYNAHRRMARRAYARGSESARALHLSGSAPVPPSTKPLPRSGSPSPSAPPSPTPSAASP